MRLTLTLALLGVLLSVIFGSTFIPASHASNTHGENMCPAQVWDQKVGPNDFWWKAVTACNDHPAEQLQHTINLQYFDWSTYTWRSPSYGFFAGSDFWVDFIGHNRTWNVEDYEGIFCWRIKSRHWVWEWLKGEWADARSSSGGQCY